MKGKRHNISKLIGVFSALCLIAGSAAAAIPAYAQETSQVPALQEDGATDYTENSAQTAAEEEQKKADAAAGESGTATVYTNNEAPAVSKAEQDKEQTVTVSTDIPMQVASSEEFVLSAGGMTGKLMAKNFRAAANKPAGKNFTTAVGPGENPNIFGDGILVANSSSGDYINTTTKQASSKETPPSSSSESEEKSSSSVSSSSGTSSSSVRSSSSKDRTSTVRSTSSKAASSSGSRVNSKKTSKGGKVSQKSSGRTVISSGVNSEDTSVQDESYTETGTEEQTQEEEIAPKTGDTADPGAYLLIAAASALILAAVCIARRGKNR